MRLPRFPIRQMSVNLPGIHSGSRVPCDLAASAPSIPGGDGGILLGGERQPADEVYVVERDLR